MTVLVLVSLARISDAMGGFLSTPMRNRRGKKPCSGTLFGHAVRSPARGAWERVWLRTTTVNTPTVSNTKANRYLFKMDVLLSPNPWRLHILHYCLNLGVPGIVALCRCRFRAR